MKTIITTLAATLFLAAGTGAASAIAYTGIGHCDGLKGDSSSWSTTRLEYKLREEGINFDEIGTFGPCFKVIRTKFDGTKELMLFDPSTLNRVYIY